MLLSVCIASIVLVQAQAGFAQEGEQTMMDLPQAIPASDTQVGEAAGLPQVAPDVVMEEIPSELLATTLPTSTTVFTLDYRFKTFCNSHTTYALGTPQSYLPAEWSPLSRLRFPINSSWNGLQAGLEFPNVAMHVEWLTPISSGINGHFADYDWQNPADTKEVTDLGYSKERWDDGQTINLDLEFKLSDKTLAMPIELWPITGFRWQRFSLTGYDLYQELSGGMPDGRFFPVDVITFNQQYYQCYLGGQLRHVLRLRNEKQICLTFQGDWGWTWGYSIDHHLITDVPFYAYQRTQGGGWHLGLTAEMPVTRRLSLGVQGDYLNIKTTGKTWEDREVNPWVNGVAANSEQTSVTAFGRFSF